MHLFHSLKKHRLSMLVFAILCVCFVIWTTSNRSAAQNIEPSNLAAYLRHLDQSGVTFYIGFVSPIDEARSGWYVPEQLGDNAETAGRRIISEIGTDYICFEEIYQGYEEFFCVPFSNIAYIRHYPFSAPE